MQNYNPTIYYYNLLDDFFSFFYQSSMNLSNYKKDDVTSYKCFPFLSLPYLEKNKKRQSWKKYKFLSKFELINKLNK